ITRSFAISSRFETWKFPHSRGFRGKGYHRSSKASRCEDLQGEEPSSGWDGSAFDFHPTLPGMLSPTLIGHQGVQMCQPREKRLLAALWMMQPWHRKQVPRDGVMRLIEQRTGHGHLGGCKHCIPPAVLS